jgi:hypothetical protein
LRGSDPNGSPLFDYTFPGVYTLSVSINKG